MREGSEIFLHRLRRYEKVLKTFYTDKEVWEGSRNLLSQREKCGKVLAYPDFSKRFMLKFYACKASIGAVLLQVDDDNKEHLVAYFSRMLSREELKYTLTLLEVKCLRLLEGMRHF